MDTQLARVNQKTAAIDLMVTRYPNKWKQIEELSNAVSQHLLNVFAGRISQENHRLFCTEANNPKCDHLWPIFDGTIISEALTLGWRVFASEIVIRRIERWNDLGKMENGPELLEKLFAAIVTNSKVKRGIERFPLNAPELYQTRKKAVAEVKALCKRLSASAKGLTKIPRGVDLHAVIRREIETPQRYPVLRMNVESFCTYLTQQDLDQDGNFTVQLVKKGAGVTPAGVVDGWFDWGSCSSEGQSRKAISKIGSRKRC